LGWGYGDRELFALEDMLSLFRLEDLNPSAACFDLEKLKHWNAHYLRQKKPDFILEMIQALYPHQMLWNKEGYAKLMRGLPALQERSQTLQDVYRMLPIYAFETLDTAGDISSEDRLLLEAFLPVLNHINPWNYMTLETQARAYCHEKSLKLRQLAQPLRVALTGFAVSPPIFDVMEILGLEWCMKRLERASKQDQMQPEKGAFRV